MPNGENARLKFESGQQSFPMSALTNSGDNKIFDSSASKFSRASGVAPDIKPDGVVTGGVASPALSGSNDVVDVTALTCYLAGVLTSVTASVDEAITRASTDVASISSITVDSAGNIPVVQGADSVDTSFSETRGAAGGPPFIPVGSIEVAQVRLTSNVAAPITSAEIFSVVGVHRETYNFPLWTVDYFNAQVSFEEALSTIHTGNTTKGVSASYANPIFSEIQFAGDFVAPENSYSVSSTQYYSRTKGSSSKTLGQGSFTGLLDDGVTDPIVLLEGEYLWFEFTPDVYKTPKVYCQGTLGMTRAWPAGTDYNGSFTISAEEPAVNSAA